MVERTLINHRIYIKFLLIVLAIISTTLLFSTCTPSSTDTETNKNDSETSKEVDAESFADKLAADFPTDIAFSRDKMFFTEKSGRLKVVQKGRRQAKKLKEFSVPSQLGYNEIGLLGIALSPDFENDKKIYLYHTYESDGELLNRVISIDSDQPENDPKVIIDGIKGNRIHDGGKLAFGPDRKLYIATGDAGDKSTAQDRESLNGKVLRVDPDGTIPSDNPFSNAVWSIGHRNIFGMTFDDSGRLFVTENGPEKDDEINEIKRGANYGWPDVTGVTKRSLDNPIITIERSIAPTGIIFYQGDKFQDLKGHLIFADFVKGDIHEIDFSVPGKVSQKVIANVSQGVNAIAASPDGGIYVATEDKVKKIEF